MLGFACVIFGSVPAWAQSSLEQTLRGGMVMRVLEWSESHLRDLVAYAKAGVVLDGRIANPPDAASWAELNHDAVRQFVARFWLADDIARYNTRLSRSAPSAPQVDPEAERVLTQSRAVALEILRSYDKDTAQLRLWDADHAAARARERAAFAAWVAQRASLATQVAEDDQWQSEALDNLEARRKTLLVEKLDWESRRAALLADEAHYHDSRRLGIVASTLGSAAGGADTALADPKPRGPDRQGEALAMEHAQLAESATNLEAHVQELKRARQRVQTEVLRREMRRTSVTERMRAAEHAVRDAHAAATRIGQLLRQRLIERTEAYGRSPGKFAGALVGWLDQAQRHYWFDETNTPRFGRGGRQVARWYDTALPALARREVNSTFAAVSLAEEKGCVEGKRFALSDQRNRLDRRRADLSARQVERARSVRAQAHEWRLKLEVRQRGSNSSRGLARLLGARAKLSTFETQAWLALLAAEPFHNRAGMAAAVNAWQASAPATIERLARNLPASWRAPFVFVASLTRAARDPVSMKNVSRAGLTGGSGGDQGYRERIAEQMAAQFLPWAAAQLAGNLALEPGLAARSFRQFAKEALRARIRVAALHANGRVSHVVGLGGFAYEIAATRTAATVPAGIRISGAASVKPPSVSGHLPRAVTPVPSQ